MSNSPPTVKKPGAGLEGNGARGKKRRTATSQPRKRAELSRGQRPTGLTDSPREIIRKVNFTPKIKPSHGVKSGEIIRKGQHPGKNESISLAKSRAASVQAWEEFGKRCRVRCRTGGKRKAKR